MNQLNNFNFLRFIFATFVIISHSSSLSNIPLPGYWPTQLAKFGVFGFFVISGFLVTSSLERSSNILIFIKKRIKRIFPALLVMGAFITISFSLMAPDVRGYFFNHSTVLHFLSTIFLIPFNKCLPDLFNNNPTGCSVNGSLWTLRYELAFYCLLAFLKLIKRKENRKKVITWAAFITIPAILFWLLHNNYIPSSINTHVYRLFSLASYFLFGSLIYYHQNLLTKKAFIFSIITITIISFLNVGDFINLFYPILYSFIVIYIGISFNFYLNFYNRLGDLSYGMYIYAYPIQQAIIQQYKPTSLSFILVTTMILSMICGFLSWHLIEKHTKVSNI